MRRANASELSVEVVPVLTANLSEKELKELFPIPMDELDPFAEAEPSVGALVQLRSGNYFVVTYGNVTNTVKLLIPVGSDRLRGIEEILAEAPIPSAAVRWRVSPEAVSSKGS